MLQHSFHESQLPAVFHRRFSLGISVVYRAETSFVKRCGARSRAQDTQNGVPSVCGRNQGIGTTSSTQRRDSGDCSTTTSYRKKHPNWYRNRHGGPARRVVGLFAFFFGLYCLSFRHLPNCAAESDYIWDFFFFNDQTHARYPST